MGLVLLNCFSALFLRWSKHACFKMRFWPVPSATAHTPEPWLALRGVWMEEEEEEEEEEEDLVGYRRFRIPSCPVRLDDSSAAAALCGVAAVESASKHQ
jgi:hypothetical protein